MRFHFRHTLVGVFLVASSCLALMSCGGGKAPAKTPSENPHTAESPGRVEESGAAASTLESRASCADGTCFECGRGVCLTGFYCDENAQGGPGCSWLPECPSRTSCACVTKVLGESCSCDERGGGVFVKCR